MTANWALWRPVVSGCASLMEVCNQWTIDDLMDAHEVLDALDEAKLEEMKRAGL